MAIADDGAVSQPAAVAIVDGAERRPRQLRLVAVDAGDAAVAASVDASDVLGHYPDFPAVIALNGEIAYWTAIVDPVAVVVAIAVSIVDAAYSAAVEIVTVGAAVAITAVGFALVDELGIATVAVKQMMVVAATVVVLSNAPMTAIYSGPVVVFWTGLASAVCVVAAIAFGIVVVAAAAGVFVVAIAVVIGASVVVAIVPTIASFVLSVAGDAVAADGEKQSCWDADNAYHDGESMKSTSLPISWAVVAVDVPLPYVLHRPYGEQSSVAVALLDQRTK